MGIWCAAPQIIFLILSCEYRESSKISLDMHGTPQPQILKILYYESMNLFIKNEDCVNIKNIDISTRDTHSSTQFNRFKV